MWTTSFNFNWPAAPAINLIFFALQHNSDGSIDSTIRNYQSGANGLTIFSESAGFYSVSFTGMPTGTPATGVSLIIYTGTVSGNAITGEIAKAGPYGILDEQAATNQIATTAAVAAVQATLGLTGTAQSGTANSITLANTSSAVNSLYVGQSVQLLSGTGAGQVGLITAYVGATRKATVYPNWITAPDNTTTYLLAGTAIQAIKDQTDLIATNNGDSPNASVAQGIINTLAGTEGVAQAGSANTITLSAGDSAPTGTYIGQSIFLFFGTGKGQLGLVTAYNGSTKVATVVCAATGGNWITNPDATTHYLMFGIYATSIPTTAQIAAGVWTSTVAGNFTVPNSAGISIFTGKAPGDVTGGLVKNNAAMSVAAFVVAGSTTFNGITSGTIIGSLSGSVGSVANIAAQTGDSYAVVHSGTFGNAALLAAIEAGSGGIGVDGIAQAGSATTITLAAGDTAPTNTYTGQTIYLTGGTGANQSRVITAYNGSTKVTTVSPAWTTNPASGTTYLITGQLPSVTTQVAVTVIPPVTVSPS